METFKKTVHIGEDMVIGKDKLFLMAGPCAVESLDICLEIGEQLKEICGKLDIQYVFKASFDKANRTSGSSFRGHGMHDGLDVLAKVGEALSVPVITDVHESGQVESVAQAVDMLQIPAFLCRQTDLLVATGNCSVELDLARGGGCTVV